MDALQFVDLSNIEYFNVVKVCDDSEEVLSEIKGPSDDRDKGDSTQQDFTTIQSEDDDDSSMLIKFPFTRPLKLSGVRVLAEDAETCPTIMKIFINDPFLDFSEAAEKPCTQQFSISPDQASSHEEGAVFPLHPSKFSRCDMIGLFFISPGQSKTVIRSVQLLGTPADAGAVGELPKFKGWAPFSKSKSINAFIRNNTKKGGSGQVLNKRRIDLHDLQVTEALAIIEFLVRKAQVLKTVDWLDVITGKGSHSKDGKPNIKPAVERWLESHGFPKIEWAAGGVGVAPPTVVPSFAVDPRNEGRLRVYFSLG